MHLDYIKISIRRRALAKKKQQTGTLNQENCLAHVPRRKNEHFIDFRIYTCYQKLFYMQNIILMKRESIINTRAQQHRAIVILAS